MNGGAVLKARIDLDLAWRCYTNPRGLHVHHLKLWSVVFVDHDRSSGRLLQFHCSADVIDMSVRDQDLRDFESVPLSCLQYSADLRARIDDNRLARSLIAYYRTITLQWTDRKDFVDHR